MNFSLAIFLLSDAVRMLKVSYELDPVTEKPKKLYGYKTFDASIKKGDYVIVPTDTRHGMTVCRVEEEDVPVDDFEDRIDYKWILGTVDTVEFESIDAQEKLAIEKIKTAAKRQKREELKESLLNNLTDEEKGSLLLTGPADATPEPTVEPRK